MKVQLFFDEIDEAAAREGSAIREFRREFSLTRYTTRSAAKRGIVRGNLGAKQRGKLIRVPRLCA